MKETKLTKKVISLTVALGMISALCNVPAYAAVKLRVEAENSALNDFVVDETVDDSYEGLRGGNLKYTFTVQEPGQYRLSYSYCSFDTADVFPLRTAKNSTKQRKTAHTTAIKITFLVSKCFLL